MGYYFINKILFSLMFLVIPLLLFLEFPDKKIIYIANLLIGVFRSSFWAMLIMILHTERQRLEKGNNSSQNFKLFLGIWASSYDFGTICGFFFSSFIVYTLKFDWKWCLYIGSLFCIVMALVVYITSKNQQ